MPIYGISWAHNLYGFQSPCDSKLVKNVLEAAKWDTAKPVSKKQPVTPAMISAELHARAWAESQS